ncbi:MAG: thioredoxin domain-containing protein [Minisyncoccia bacterium]
MKQSTIFFVLVIVLVLGGIFTVVLQSGKGNAPGKYDTFAQCLKDKGATFYGAFWCPHCKEQKALFGSSVKFLSYVECSTPDASGQTQQCKDKKIEGYPTWELADGTRLPVENGAGVSLKTLSEKTSCVLPE